MSPKLVLNCDWRERSRHRVEGKEADCVWFELRYFAVDLHSENTTNHIQDTGLTTYTALEYIVLREAST